jgi:uncharacterized small protein (DUF1192 family)
MDMGLFDDMDPFGVPPKKKLAHDIGETLDALSVHELDERIALLREEIGRLETAREAKRASLAAASAAFKSS